MNRCRILVVDDEEKITNLIKNYLEKEGFEVFTADGGKKALELFDTKNPDLIVLDLMMPDIGGYDVCRKICATSKTPVIMLTARSEEIDKLWVWSLELMIILQNLQLKGTAPVYG